MVPSRPRSQEHLRKRGQAQGSLLSEGRIWGGVEAAVRGSDAEFYPRTSLLGAFSQETPLRKGSLVLWLPRWDQGGILAVSHHMKDGAPSPSSAHVASHPRASLGHC